MHGIDLGIIQTQSFENRMLKETRCLSNLFMIQVCITKSGKAYILLFEKSRVYSLWDQTP